MIMSTPLPQINGSGSFRVEVDDCILAPCKQILHIWAETHDVLAWTAARLLFEGRTRLGDRSEDDVHRLNVGIVYLILNLEAKILQEIVRLGFSMLKCP